MISHFQLKQNVCFQKCYRTPYFIKNAFLLILQFTLLLFIYLIYFRADGGNMKNAMKILRGLNSNTFNYLETNKHKLMVNNRLPIFFDSRGAEVAPGLKKQMPFEEGEEINTVKFFSQCVRYNKPCYVEKFAAKFQAYEQWRTRENPNAMDHMQKLLGHGTQVTVYEQPPKSGRTDSWHDSAYSFRKDYQKNMTYEQFIQKVKEEVKPGVHALKESRTVEQLDAADHDEVTLHLENLRKMVEEPEFYANFAKLETIELIQGAAFKDKPHYEKSEQFMCNIEGEMAVVLVPHVYRQEVSGGDRAQMFHEHETPSMFQHITNAINAINGSPINFFDPDIKRFPFWKDIPKIQVNPMEAGDCIFIPAYYYYQVKSQNMSPHQLSSLLHHNSKTLYGESADPNKTVHLSTIVNFKYEGNSDLLKGIYDAIERGVIN